MKNKTNLSLVDIPINGSCKVLDLKAEGLIRRRLLDLGLVPGTQITKLRQSPVGDPMAFAIRGTVIALRREESCQVLVTPLLERV